MPNGSLHCHTLACHSLLYISVPEWLPSLQYISVPEWLPSLQYISVPEWLPSLPYIIVPEWLPSMPYISVPEWLYHCSSVPESLRIISSLLFEVCALVGARNLFGGARFEPFWHATPLLPPAHQHGVPMPPTHLHCYSRTYPTINFLPSCTTYSTTGIFVPSRHLFGLGNPPLSPTRSKHRKCM